MRRVAAAALLATLAACTSGGTPRVGPGTPTSAASATSEIGPSAAAALARLCPKPPTPAARIRPSRHVPAVVARMEREVEAVRGLRFEHPVAVAALSRRAMGARLDRATTDTLPVAQIRRQELVWKTIGAIPQSSDLPGAARRFIDTQVLGYYDAHANELVYIGSLHPTPAERFVLAHELTHALDDQHFDLTRVDRLQAACHDDEQQAATGAIEGSAVFFSTLVLDRYFSSAERHQVDRRSGSGSAPSGVPQFLLDQESWPYLDGPRFIAALAANGGTTAVNDALRNLPVSTSEVMHPDSYPTAAAAPLDVPELGPKLGAGWRDLDVEEIGEEWLRDLLGLRLDPTQAGPAAEGWDGGLERAWTDGTHVAVLLRTRWGSAQDAGEFAGAMSDWIGSGQAASVSTTGDVVDVLFASDGPTLGALRTAAARP